MVMAQVWDESDSPPALLLLKGEVQIKDKETFQEGCSLSQNLILVFSVLQLCGILKAGFDVARGLFFNSLNGKT